MSLEVVRTKPLGLSYRDAHVKHLPYKKSASIYVTKYVYDTKTNWGIVNNNSEVRTLLYKTHI